MKKKLVLLLTVLLVIVAFSEYTIRKGDVLGIWVFGYPEYSNQQILVGPDGMITVPPIGRMKAEGKDISQLENEIKEKMAIYIKSPNITLGITNYAPFRVQIIGNVKEQGIVEMPLPQLSLSKVLALAGGFAVEWKSSKVIVKYPDGKIEKYDITNLFKGLLLEDDPMIPENSTILVPFEYNNDITVYTDFGIKTLQFYDGITLNDIISEAISVTEVNLQMLDNNIMILRGNNILNITFDELKTKKIMLEKGDTVVIKKLDKYVYVFGIDEKGGKVLFEKDESFDLKTLMAKLGIDPKKVLYKVYDKKTGKPIEVTENYEFAPGQFVEFTPIENYVFVNGRGKIIFEPNESFDLNTLIGKLGIDKDTTKVKIYDPETKETFEATTNINLKNNMSIEFISQEKYIYMTGRGKIVFRKNEKFDLDTLIGKYGIDKDSAIIKIFDPETKETIEATKNIDFKPGMFVDVTTIDKVVYITGDIARTMRFSKNEKIDKQTILAKLGILEDNVKTFEVENGELKAGAIIKIKIKKNYVYLFGAFNYNGKLDFNLSEPMTLSAIIARARGFRSDFSGRIIVLGDNYSKTYYIEENKVYNDIIDSGMTLLAETSKRNVYILGEGVVPGTYVAKYSESIWDILLKSGFIPSKKYEIVIKDENGVYKLNGAEAQEKLSIIPVVKPIYINVVKTQNDNIIVYKNGMIKTLTPKNQDYVTLINLYSAIDGFSPSRTGTITIYQNNEKIAEYTNSDVINNPMAKIPMGTYVTVETDVNLNYITILGNTSPRSIKTEVSIPLTELLGQISIDWRSQEVIKLYLKSGEVKEINLDSVENLNKILVEPGTVVYIPSTHNQVVYIFGEVLKPGMIPYTKGLNVIEALFKAGVNKQTAELSNVYLFTDGPDQPPIVLNLKDFYNGSNVPEEMNKLLEPGDIIFVPKNAMTNVLGVMSIVNNFMSFFNNGYATYSNINNIIQGK
ncbi:polysaccharide biosynthesis/export family protein [Marinitoga sp. 1137]|uniref:polysaccharide biosynthesis/export family protein n=1 Tax=Marinitoga sp. 1137 TaxID=1545835 RepID=UPI000951C38B|nr:polysaccharide biosynthesis/export family protein [Marinitoga sp. 1137]